MFRRLISIVLLLSFAVSQWAAMIAYAHAGMELPGHDAHPHLHLSSLFSGNDSTPREERRGHAHRHASHRIEDHHDDDTYSFAPLFDHSADVIYLPTGMASVDDAGSQSLKLHVTSDELPSAAASDQVAIDVQSAYSCFWSQSPEFCATHCALYLKLRALRI